MWEKIPLYAICTTCSSDISRAGASRKDLNTSNLIRHFEAEQKTKIQPFIKAIKGCYIMVSLNLRSFKDIMIKA